MSLCSSMKGFINNQGITLTKCKFKARPEHIARNHMAHSQRSDKSYFISSDKAFIYQQLVQETTKRSDKSMLHRRLHNRGVRQKTFSEIVCAKK